MKNDLIKLIAIIGKSGSGKNTVWERCALQADMDKYNVVVSCTTRPRREGEVNGADYHFISREEMIDKMSAGELAEVHSFREWTYATEFAAFDKNKINIGVFNTYSIESFLESEEFDIECYEITASDKTRMLRQLNRVSNPDVDEIVRRYKTEKEDFSAEKFDYFNAKKVKDVWPNSPFHLTYLINEEKADLQFCVDRILDRSNKFN